VGAGAQAFTGWLAGGGQRFDGRTGDLTDGHHHPRGTTLRQLFDQVGHQTRTGGPFHLQRHDNLGIQVEGHTRVAIADQASRRRRLMAAAMRTTRA